MMGAGGRGGQHQHQHQHQHHQGGNRNPISIPMSINDTQIRVLSNQLNDIISKEKDEATAEERKEAWDDVHGNFNSRGESQQQQQDENPLLWGSYMDSLDLAVRNLPRSGRQELDRAYFYNPSMLTGQRILKMMFMRRTQYDATKAAKLMAKFFEQKEDWFGSACLGRDITLDDFTAEELTKIVELQKAPIYVPNQRDPSGRPIAFLDFRSVLSKFQFQYPKLFDRMAFYQIMVQLKNDVDLQKKGAVVVLYCPFCSNLLQNLPPIPELLRHFQDISKYIDSVPYKETSFHFCHDNSAMNFIVATLNVAFGKHFRMRMTSHYGSVTEIRHSLQSFGIRIDERYFHAYDGPTTGSIVAPFAAAVASSSSAISSRSSTPTLMDEYLQRRHRLEIEEKRQQDAIEASTGIIVHPQKKDVLMGRGLPYRQFIGNQRWGKLIETQLPRYQQCGDDRFSKTCISMQVVKVVQDYGGRFLQRQEGQGWTVLDDVKARDKTLRAFRPRMNREE